MLRAQNPAQDQVGGPRPTARAWDQGGPDQLATSVHAHGGQGCSKRPRGRLKGRADVHSLSPALPLTQRDGCCWFHGFWCSQAPGAGPGTPWVHAVDFAGLRRVSQRGRRLGGAQRRPMRDALAGLTRPAGNFGAHSGPAAQPGPCAAVRTLQPLGRWVLTGGGGAVA
jgi:hypothetical protein